MKTSRNGFVIRWFIACLVLLFVAPGAEAQEKKLLRVVFVSLSWNSEIPVRVALARGFFKAQGLQIEPIFIRGGPAAIAALISGEVDFASIGGAQAVIRGKARGLTFPSSARFPIKPITSCWATNKPERWKI